MKRATFAMLKTPRLKPGKRLVGLMLLWAVLIPVGVVLTACGARETTPSATLTPAPTLAPTLTPEPAATPTLPVVTPTPTIPAATPTPTLTPSPAPSPAVPAVTIVTFPDENLEAAIREALGKPAGEKITAGELAELTELTARELGIVDLSGIEHLSNLTQLDISQNQISDLAPLASLSNLTSITLIFNQISDVTPLTSLYNLSSLSLFRNQISDISPLASLSNLSSLNLSFNQISDISPLVENSGLGPGDNVLLVANPLDLSEGSEDLENIRQLEARGVSVRR